MDDKQDIAGFDEDMREIFDSYLVESKEILDHLSQDLLALEKKPSNADLLNNIFRGVHTLKGTSSFLGFNQMTELTHTSEDLLNKLRKGEIIADGKIIDVLIEVRNAASVLLQRIESRDLQPVELNGILEKLRGAMQQQPAAIQVENVVQEKKDQAPQTSETFEVMHQRAADPTIRVDIGRLDDLMNLVGELVLARNRLSQATQSLLEKYERIEMSKHIADVSSQIDFVTTELQMAVMKTRMVPIEKVFKDRKSTRLNSSHVP
jgi:two-component system chemotaxis sensor kinase CheA